MWHLFEQKPPLTKAFQWTGSRPMLDEMIKNGLAEDQIPADGSFILKDGAVCPPGYWVVLDQDGKIWISSDEFFTSRHKLH